MSTMEDADAAQIATARRVADLLWPRESLAARLGMVLESIGPGRACVVLEVRDDLLNVQGVCHGGMIFTLADQALAFAANSRNDRAVTATCSIDYLVPVPAGERLRAIAVEQVRQGRNAFYDVRVERTDGVVVAILRGRAAAVGGHHFDPS